ncbi:pyocin knob domain-containing protein [Paenibacillus lautus]|uniref:pyocin knob domain-containing protein n=1 Tax=Paenibacillus lautus TaxID=1401 RepID=UPI002DBF061D|nr:pyocin knob domain-containing protein [Paenibacillus lautus]MEC0306831.1 pyocin knob domain-containing protein [Paenibacillus lautus]
MPSQTPNMGLYKVNGETDGNDTFNVDVVLNDNWDKLDAAVGQIQEDLDNVTVTVPDASLTTKGITQLSNATNSTSESMAATPKAVKDAYDRGNVGVTAAAAAQAKADAAETPAGAQVKANVAETNAKTYAENYTKQNSALAGWSAGYRSAKHIAGGDLNLIYDTGFYDGFGLTNAPTNEWYFYQVMSHSSGPTTWRTQLAYNFNDNSKTYRRSQINGNWTPWVNIGKLQNISDDPTEINYYVPSVYPTIQSAINAMPKLNATRRKIIVAANHVENGNIEIRNFKGGGIEISGNTNGKISARGNVNIDGETSCQVSISHLRLDSSGGVINCQAPCNIYLYEVHKTASSTVGAIWLGGACRGTVNWCTISNQGEAFYVFSSAVVHINSITGSGNARGITASAGIAMVSSMSNFSATTKYASDSGGRIFE